MAGIGGKTMRCWQPMNNIAEDAINSPDNLAVRMIRALCRDIHSFHPITKQMEDLARDDECQVQQHPYHPESTSQDNSNYAEGNQKRESESSHIF
jgi:hypothetical protein